MDARTKDTVAALRIVLEQLESGKRRVVHGSVALSVGEPMSMSLNGTVYSQKVSIELELVAQDPSGAEGVVA